MLPVSPAPGNGAAPEGESPNEPIDIDLFIFRSLILLIFSAGRACERKASNRRRVSRAISLFSAEQILCGWTAARLGRLSFHTSMEATDAVRHLRDRRRDHRPRE